MVRGTLRRVKRPSPRRTRDSRVELWATRTHWGRLWTIRTPLGRLRTLWVVSGLLWVVSGRVGPTWGDLGLASAGPLQVVCRTSRTHLGRLWMSRTHLGRLWMSRTHLASDLRLWPLQVVCRTIRIHLGLLWMSRTHLGRRRLGLNIIWSGSNPLRS